MITKDNKIKLPDRENDVENYCKEASMDVVTLADRLVTKYPDDKDVKMIRALAGNLADTIGYN
jgi:hypothetical protein